MKILLTGATGLLGRYFLESTRLPQDCEILALSKSLHEGLGWRAAVRSVAAPFEDRAAIADLMQQFRPHWVIHAGGENNVDRVEKDPESAARLNVDFPLFLMEEAWALRARWVVFSSNAVYGGEAAPYSESAAARPLSAYGRFKARVDAQTRHYPGQWVIFRPTVSYGWNLPFGRANPVTFFLPLLRAGRELRLVDDQYENPVYADDVGSALWRVIEREFQGEVNVGGGDSRVSRYDWMRAMARAFGCDEERIVRASLADFPQSAPRPKDTSFDTAKLVSQLGVQPLDVFTGALHMKKDSSRDRS